MISDDERGLVMEAVRTLCNHKQNLFLFVLSPAGFPVESFRAVANVVDPLTEKPLSKRKMAPLILNEIEKLPNASDIIHNIIKITAVWDKYHLSYNRFEAQETVTHARAVLDAIEANIRRENEETEREEQEYRTRLARERRTLIEQQSPLLTQMLAGMQGMSDHQERGRILEDLLNRVFTLHEIEIRQPFRRNHGAEQIDGAFRFDGWHYLVECKWHREATGPSDVDTFMTKVARSGQQTMGMFLAMESFTQNVVPLLKQNPQKRVFLFDGYDLFQVLNTPLDLCAVIRAKLERLNVFTEPFYSVREYLISA